MTEQQKKEVINSIKKGGFLSELRVSRIFNLKNWLTLNNYVYLDKEKSINKEIDLLCIKKSSKNSFRKLRLAIHLSVEVKKSEKGWVFFVSRKEPSTLELGYPSLFTYKNINYEMMDSFFHDHPRQSLHFVSTSYCEPFRDKSFEESAVSNIYKALDSAIKATYYIRSTSILERNKPTSSEENGMELYAPIDKNFQSEINLYIPLIVLQGQLIKAELDSNSDIQIEECQYVPYESYYIDSSGYENFYAVDVVQIDYLGKYLEDLEQWLDDKALQILEIREQ